jgi:hypothetical protein
MKNSALKLYSTAFLFCSSLVMFAQTPGTDDETGSLEDVDAVPVNDYIWVLVAIGLVFAFHRFKALSHQRSLQK